MNNSGHSRLVRVLGVDPAAAGPTGYGSRGSGRPQLPRVLHYGALRVGEKRKESAGALLKPSTLSSAISSPNFLPTFLRGIRFSALNVKTALRLAEVRGVVLLAAAQHQVEVFQLRAARSESLRPGYGHADKRQMQLMVRALLAMTKLRSRLTPPTLSRWRSAICKPTKAADVLALVLFAPQMFPLSRARLPVQLAQHRSSCHASQLCDEFPPETPVRSVRALARPRSLPGRFRPIGKADLSPYFSRQHTGIYRNHRARGL